MNKFWGATGSAVIICLLLVCSLAAQSPHGENLRISCDACHTAENWKINQDTLAFNHDTMRFGLQGQHAVIDCRACHTTLIFERTPLDCASCHTDMHQGTVGLDCARCHDSDSWLVNNITEIHQDIAFPLIGAHAVVNCFECHISDTDLRFDHLGTDCVNCHREEYASTTNPDHKAAGFSTECQECHTITAFEWSASGIDHSFFPLTLGHEINDCARCHSGPDYSSASPDCFACHQQDHATATEPNHIAASLPTDCASCHTTNPEWEPAEFTAHDGLYFPIYSGKHNGEWSQCTDCHGNSNDYSQFSCTTCHANPETDSHHDNVTGYSYHSDACLACHPTGSADDGFDHDHTGFLLTGVHTTTECIACHFAGYAGTPTECVACHDKDYQQTINPNHNSLGLSMDCASCHTTDPEWDPAAFPDHNEFYVLAGVHAMIATECVRCHNGDYINTPNTCVGCHLAEFNTTTDPNHTAAQFSTDCTTCHSEQAWQPATFDHDAEYFPIYSGSHEGEWSQCVDCHTNPSNYAEFTCVTCHANPETDEEHNGVSGYVYNSSACLACHPTGDGEGFEHNLTEFPLTGAHLATDCIQCHASGYAGTPTECASCHTTDFNQSVNPNHGALGISTDCAMCHTTQPGWSPAAFPVHNEYYALQGAHVPISMECALCHNGDYTNTPNTCAGCHIDDYAQTADPDHETAQFPTDCILCHTQSAWQPATLDHNLTDFPLTGAHVTVDCASCHTAGYTGTPTECAACHTTNFNQAANPNHVILGISTDCASCHTTNPDWSPATFPVHDDFYVLQGAHANIAMECILCHNGEYNNTPNTCVGCHFAEYNATTDPNHSAEQYPTDCIICHSETAWTPATFDHNLTDFPLTGAHVPINCASCHASGYTGTPTECAACHISDYNATTDPNHAASGFPTECAVCHTTSAWEPASFDHNLTDFPLTGGHASVDCASCHASGYTGTPTDCAACHISDYNATTDPNHAASGFPTECAVCHTTSAWEPASFDHNLTDFPLTGGHASVDCASCHASGYTGTPTDCAACHQTDFNQATNPNHVVLGLSTDCAQCHTTNPDWDPAEFDVHNNYYVLQGAHAAIANECALCHNGNYTNTPNTCVGCHISDYNQTNNPDHEALQYPTDCIICHSESAWEPATFDHNQTDFPLTGAHIPVDCASCHAGGYSGTPTDCAACHQTDFNQSTNPNHVVLGLSTDCAQCHTTNPDWNPAEFDVHNNYYVLQGAHAAIANECATCHNGNYNNTPNTCVGCHLSEYNGTTDPDHEVLQYPTDCIICHSETAWEPATFDHNLTDFPLTGAHIPVDCASCHAGGYSGTPTDCAACHQTDFNQSTNPNHVVLGLSTDCAQCHTTNPDWNPAEFDVHNNYYVLQGAHAAIANECASCHNGNYNNTPNTCVGCHLADYNGTNDPDHQSAQFPTDCAQCHSQNAWEPATFDHDDMYFPIYSGKHEDEWDQCNDCHTNPNDYAVFTCLTCHTLSETNNDHDEVSGYQYNSNACLACHPDGEN